MGTKLLDELLANKEVLNELLQGALGERASSYGLEVSKVGVKDIILPGEMKTLLNQVAEMIKGKNISKKPLNIRVEVHVALSYKGRNRFRLARAKRLDLNLSARRGRVIVNYLRRKGVAGRLVRSSAIGSTTPIKQPAWRPINNRADFIRITQ